MVGWCMEEFEEAAVDAGAPRLRSDAPSLRACLAVARFPIFWQIAQLELSPKFTFQVRFCLIW